jgi:hypothetical protein
MILRWEYICLDYLTSQITAFNWENQTFNLLTMAVFNKNVIEDGCLLGCCAV